MSRYYFLIVSVFSGLFVQSQDCTVDNILDYFDGWSGNTGRFEMGPQGWQLNDSFARESFLEYRFDTLVTGIQLQFSLDFPPSDANSLKVSLQLESRDGRTAAQVHLSIGESGSLDGIMSTVIRDSGQMTEDEFWKDSYGDGVDHGAWNIVADEKGIVIREPGSDRRYSIIESTDLTTELLIRSIRLTCRYTITRATRFVFHKLYTVDEGSWPFDEIDPGTMFISEYRTGAEQSESFIEILNVFDEIKCIIGLSISINGAMVQIPATSIQPGKYLMLTDSVSTLEFDGDTRQFRVPFPVNIPENEFEILLYQYGQLIHGALARNSTDHRSMELVDIAQPCRLDNWALSLLPDGSPGMGNSHFGSLPVPEIKLAWETSTTALLNFPFLMYGSGLPEELITSNTSFQWTPTDLWGTGRLGFTDQIGSGDSIVINVNGNQTTCGQDSYFWDTTFVTSPPHMGGAGDLVITEIMYQPPGGCPEYLEISNLEGSAFWWDGLWLQKNASPPVGVDIHGNWKSMESRIVTEDRALFLECYPECEPEIVTESDLFMLNNNGSTLALYSDESGESLIERVSYHPSDHNNFIYNTSGVALERDITRIMGNNWRSGYVQLGYRSPGFLPDWEPASEDLVEFSATTIYTRPGRDPSILEIGIGAHGVDANITIEIFDLEGRKVSTLADALPLQGGEVITWKGMTSSGTLLPEGLYLFWIYYFDVSGYKKIIRKTCVLSNN